MSTKEGQETASGTSSRHKATSMIHPADLNAMLKDNREIGRLSHGIPRICASVCDEFVKELLKDCIKEDGNSFDLAILINAIKTNKKYDFLEQFIPQFQEILDSQNKKRKPKEE